MSKVVRAKKELTLRQLQTENFHWVKKNFSDRTKDHPLIGLVEEVGELCHAHLKHAHKIRGFQDLRKFEEYAEDAVGDIIIFLADYCNAHNLDIQDCLEETWAKVKKRKWDANLT